MKILRDIALILTGLAFSCLVCLSREKIGSQLEIDKLVHNFGNIVHKSGPVSCSFVVTNSGTQPAVIYNVVSTCGCTNVQWTKEPIRPGQSGKISVTYSNDEGAYPFDKTLTAYISDIKKPVILRIRGISHEKKKNLEELYTTRFGSFGLKETYMQCGNLEQGGVRSDVVNVANLSNQPLKVEFADVTSNLKINITPNPIPARSTAEMEFSVYASRDKWGKNDYWATPLLNGKSYTATDGAKAIGVWAFTRENFSSLTQEQRDNGPIPIFEESTFSFGRVKQGTVVHATFKAGNEGKETLKIYKVDINACKWSHSAFPAVAPRDEVEFRVHLDTSKMPKGEALAIVTLITNSPLRPIVNLYIAGWLD